MPVWINSLASTNFATEVYLILLKTMVCYWVALKYPKLPVFKNVCWLGLTTANVSLFLILGLRWIISGYFPLSNLYESLLFLSWCLSFILIVIEQQTNSKVIGALTIPVTLVVVSFATLILPTPMQTASPLVPALQSNWLMMHVSMMMLSYSTLILGSLLSILFLIIQNNPSLKNKLSNITKADNTTQLLENIDSWSYRTIGLGFPFLTIGIIAGAVWANEAWGSYWSWDPKETWALITWLVFAAYMHARLTKGWVGQKAATLGSIGFVVVWVCYLGVNFLGQGLHSYGFLS
uniref:heme attachment to plastid cytochrome c n=1 Tax=Meringosphaera mediterranea TaxID=2837474 RepID=UPI00286C3A09|nr:heme attachment to plastid cytochrome c [Meringosphaera mediterranea]WLD05733.1 heme attachment to plastid cytochrome c [Meringosphaera mediterranea]WLD05857.1 heme attachment to plastid cytochrome c [Meringosphaera mediterranea]WLD06077.1 heme attachment to plastid cytochrome c [Meringosphaera mediterranea]